jgi:hypothetical protein
MLLNLESHIYESGIADMVESAEIITQDSEKYVERLLLLFRRFSKLVAEAFRDDPRFLTSRDKAYKRVVNDTSVFKLELPPARVGNPVRRFASVTFQYGYVILQSLIDVQDAARVEVSGALGQLL